MQKEKMRLYSTNKAPPQSNHWEGKVSHQKKKKPRKPIETFLFLQVEKRLTDKYKDNCKKNDDAVVIDID